MKHGTSSKRIAVTGGPGAGKTSVLQKLQQRGYVVVPDAAREIIADRKAKGLSPRPSPVEFAHAIFQKDSERYSSASDSSKFVFFDRSIIDSLGMLAELDQLPEHDRHGLLARYTYHPIAFILPPWHEIYRMDSERDQSYEDSVRVYGSVREWYVKCGYALLEVPPGSIDERCEFMLRSLGEVPRDA